MRPDERRRRRKLRRLRVTNALKRYETSSWQSDEIAALYEGVETLRYLLVERNIGSSGIPPYWFSLHRTPARAAGYVVGQEYPNDWETITLIDLDTGEEYEPIPSLIFRKDS